MAEEKQPAAWPVGVKKTKVRERILSLLGQTDLPLTAMAIASALEKAGPPVWLSTIYRSLQVLSENGTIIKTAITENGLAMYALNRHEHKHYAVCLGCHRVIAMEHCPLEEYAPKISERDFHVLGHNLEMYGYCGGCYSKLS